MNLDVKKQTSIDQMERRVVVLGSTGSIGENTINVLQHLQQQNPGQWQVAGLAAGRKAQRLIEQADLFPDAAIAIADANQVKTIEDHYQKQGESRPIYCGDGGAEALIEALKPTDLVAAVVGSAGIPATLKAIENGARRISLANKETLVAAGALFMPRISEAQAELIPVDSEHSAIFQCLNEKKSTPESLKRIVLTASGGPFRTTSLSQIQNATVEDALKHPTWKMGPKITIDSATMMNKALEVIEAHWLFNLPADQIEVIVHPQSIIHSFVEFNDHSILAQLGAPDMRTPIQYALTYPDRLSGNSHPMDWQNLSQLTFEQPDLQKFPAIRLAYDIIRTGGTSGAIFNAANEAAVAAFLERKIKFGQIVELVERTLNDLEIKPLNTLDTCWEADKSARQHVNNLIMQLKD